MMNSRGAHVICGGLTFEEVPVELREKVAFRDAQLPDALREMKRMLGLREAVLVSTCNRVEYFGATTNPEQAARAWPEFLRQFHSMTDDFAALSFQLRGTPCVEHLYSVASGLKSMVIGETEVLGQLKTPTTSRRRSARPASGSTGSSSPRSRRPSRCERARHHARHVSVGSVAVELAEKIFGDLKRCRVMVIGAGETERTNRTFACSPGRADDSRGQPHL
jgi:glutamyl-tRNA reductase